MEKTIKIAYTPKPNIYKKDDGPNMMSWDTANDVKINDVGFYKNTNNTIRISSDYDLIEITPINFNVEVDIQINNKEAVITDVNNSGFSGQTTFIFNMRYMMLDAFECLDVNGNEVNSFLLGDDGIVYAGVNNNIGNVSVGYDCCKYMGYEFDSETATCYWAVPCDFGDEVKIIINPQGDDGVIFQVDDNETCILDVEFDYLLEYECSKLLECSNGGDILEILSGVTLSMTLERVIPNSSKYLNVTFENPITVETIYEEKLFEIVDFPSLLANSNSGIFLLGDNQAECDLVVERIKTALGDDSSLVTPTSFYSSWLHFKISFVDESILALIRNEKIKLGLKLDNQACDMSVLVDNIQLNRVCEITDLEETFVSKCPSFELDRVIDNKKSWVAKDVLDEREFNLSKRETDYNINHHQLGINTKEVDLNISASRAIETDVMSAILANPCLLGSYRDDNVYFDLEDGVMRINGGDYFENDGSDVSINSYGYEVLDDYNLRIFSQDPIVSAKMTLPLDYTGVTYVNDYEIIVEIDYNVTDVYYVDILTQSNNQQLNMGNLITSELTGSTFTLEDFNNILTSELIDVKDRQTIRDYPVLRALYERYLNSLRVCGVVTNGLNYYHMDDFISLIGNYWVDLIEQVIPSTTIWGSTYKYNNTIFDNNKFKYRKGTLFTCEVPDTIPLNTIGSESIDVIKTLTISGVSTTDTCNGVYMVQINDGSEFIGTVNILGGVENSISGDFIILNESSDSAKQKKT